MAEALPGATLWDLSNEVYGSGKYATQIQEANNITDPTTIKPGDKIKLPEIANLPKNQQESILNFKSNVLDKVADAVNNREFQLNSLKKNKINANNDLSAGNKKTNIDVSGSIRTINNYTDDTPSVGLSSEDDETEIGTSNLESSLRITGKINVGNDRESISGEGNIDVLPEELDTGVTIAKGFGAKVGYTISAASGEAAITFKFGNAETTIGVIGHLLTAGASLTAGYFPKKGIGLKGEISVAIFGGGLEIWTKPIQK